MSEGFSLKRFEALWNIFAEKYLAAEEEVGQQENITSHIEVGTQESTLEEHNEAGPVPLDAAARSYLEDIRKYSSWSGADGKRQLQSLRELFNRQYPGHGVEVDEAIAQGRWECSLYEKAYKLGSQGAKEASLNELLGNDKTKVASKFVRGKATDQYQRGRAAARKWQAERARKKNGQGLSSVQSRERSCSPTKFPISPLLQKAPLTGPDGPMHANDLRLLHSSSHWVILVDEGGQLFDESAAGCSKQRLGRFVALAVRANGGDLSPLPCGWHAVDCAIGEIDKAIQSLLDASVGVLGIDVSSVPATPGERWLDGVALLIDWCLRLLSLNGPTKIEFLIEQRGNFQAGQSWDVVRRDCLRKLALAFPSRALNIDLDIRLIRKNDHPLNGYVDALAYTWAQTNDSSKERLRRSGMAGTCLLNSSGGADARAMLNAWDAFAQGVHLPPAAWWDMLCSPDASNPASLLAHLMTLVGEEAKSNVKVWQPYLSEVKMRMAASPIELRRMSQAIDWLQHHKPADADILPAMRMVWLTIQLAQANHMGGTEKKWNAELASLGDQLFDEAAPLVCHADLHLAVAATNRFDFESAGEALMRWKAVPPAVPGLRYWAHVRSSMGQHAAFLGNPVRAAVLFRDAMDALARLSDPEARRGDLLQTRCYLAIALMDDPDTEHAEARKALEWAVGNLSEAASRLSGSDMSSDRYIHHLLLRWLTYRGSAEVQKVYLNRRREWKTGEGHPWPLIQLYRGMLLRATDPDAALQLALDGAQRAFEARQGPTVRLIGACCRAVAITWGQPWLDGGEELSKITEQLPFAGDRIERVRVALRQSFDPLVFLADILPFNFR